MLIGEAGMEAVVQLDDAWDHLPVMDERPRAKAVIPTYTTSTSGNLSSSYTLSSAGGDFVVKPN